MYRERYPDTSSLLAYLFYLPACMLALLKKFTSRFITPLSWTIFTIVLLCLPGSSFPGGGFLKIDHLDKIVHILLFGGMVVFWSLYYLQTKQSPTHWHLTVMSIMLSAIALGIGMEYIQLRYVPNRAFDMGDIIANTVGSILFGIFFLYKRPIGRIKKEWPL